MSRQSIPVIIGLAVFPFAAVGVAAYLLTLNSPDLPVVAGALFILAIGLFAVAMLVILRLDRHEAWLWSQHDGLEDGMRDMSQRMETLTQRLDAVERSAGQPQARLDEIMNDMKALRDGFRNLIDQGRAPAPAARAEAEVAPKEGAAPAAQPRGEHLELMLEPVIELSSGNTMHYRALIDLTDDQGHVVRHRDLMQKADQGGMRPALDAHVVKLVAPVLRRLRLRNPALRAFVPLGISTLGSRADMTRVISSLERDADVAGGIVFEFDHQGLARLDDAGIESLARVARLGATLALSNVQIGGLDLAALRQLGVRFLTVPYGSGDAGFGPTPAWREFVQYARAMQFQIVVADIETPQQASAAQRMGRYGYGSFFAPPRKVRPDAGMAAARQSASAA